MFHDPTIPLALKFPPDYLTAQKLQDGKNCPTSLLHFYNAHFPSLERTWGFFETWL